MTRLQRMYDRKWKSSKRMNWVLPLSDALKQLGEVESTLYNATYFQLCKELIHRGN